MLIRIMDMNDLESAVRELIKNIYKKEYTGMWIQTSIRIWTQR